MRNRSILFLVVGAVTLASVAADPVVGKIYSVKVADVDGHTVSTSNGRTTVLVVASRRDVDKATIVGDRIPDRCLGNPRSQMITVLLFNEFRNRAMQYVTTALVRRELDAQARRLKPRYVANKLTADPRGDIHAVADFNGQTAAALGVQSGSAQFRVLILSPNGELLQDWSRIPSSQELSAALP